MGFFDFWKGSKSAVKNTLYVDIHSHLLPGIDDGSASLEETIELIKEFIDLGYKKLIITPHIMGDYFKNTPEIIQEKLDLVRYEVKKQGLLIELEAAAEYYLDEAFIQKLERGDSLLTFGDNYLLFETSFMNEPASLKETIFLIASSGYKPVLAHPERYVYMYNSFKKYEDLFNRGLYFQLNLSSLTGYYSKESKKIAERLIRSNMVHFVGSDCHGIRHLEAIKKARNEKIYSQLLDLNIYNNNLIA